MKRNFNLIRDLIISIEDGTDEYEKYSIYNIEYHYKILDDSPGNAGYITIKKGFHGDTDSKFKLTEKGLKIYQLIKNDSIWEKSIKINKQIYGDKCYPFEMLLNTLNVLIIEENEKYKNNEMKENVDKIFFKSLFDSKGKVIYRNDYTILDFIRFFHDKDPDKNVKDFFVANSCIKINAITDYFTSKEPFKIFIDVPCNKFKYHIKDMSIKSFLEHLNMCIYRKNINKYLGIGVYYDWHNSFILDGICILKDEIYLNFIRKDFKPLVEINNLQNKKENL